MLKNHLPRNNVVPLHDPTRDGTARVAAERRNAVELLRRLADDLEANPGPWRDRVTAAVSTVLDGTDADLDAAEVRYLRDVLGVRAAALPRLPR